MSVVGKPGYKETAIGWIPSSWEATTLKSVTTESKVRNNGSLDDSTLSGVLKGRGLIPMRDRVKGATTTRCLVVEPKAFAYNPMRINIGSIAQNTAPHPVMVSPDYVVFKADSSRLLPEYLNHLRSSWWWDNFVGASGDGSVRIRIYYSHLSLLAFPLPTLPEQQKIAAILTAVDDKLDVIARQIEATQALKRGLMQTLFGRGVGRQDAEGRWVPHTEFQDSELGEIPTAWEITTLGDVCGGALQTGPFGSQLHADEYQDEGVPVLMPKDLLNYRANLDSAAKISPSRAAELARHTVKAGDLLFSRRGDVTRFALIDEASEGALCGTGCLKAKPKNNHSPAYLSHLLQLDMVKLWLEQNAVGQTMPNMNTGILASLPLVMPATLAEEVEIAGMLDGVDAKLGILQRKQTHYQALKRGLMQKLLTGEWRVKVDEVTG